MQALSIILNTLLTLLVIVFLLRVLMPLVRADFRNPIGELVLKLTNPVVLPLRRALPPGRRFDPAAIVALLLVHFVGTALIRGVTGLPFRVDAFLIGGLRDLADTILAFFFWVVLLAALLSWFGGTAASPAGRVVGRLSEPLLAPVRRVIPPLGMLDLSAIIVLVVLQLLRSLLH
jgi:YggT family protein